MEADCEIFDLSLEAQFSLSDVCVRDTHSVQNAYLDGQCVTFSTGGFCIVRGTYAVHEPCIDEVDAGEDYIQLSLPATGKCRIVNYGKIKSKDLGADSVHQAE